MSALVRRLLAAACFVLASCGAWAQSGSLETAEVLACLSPAKAERGTPEYPFDEWKAGRSGRVRVELAFPSADAGPDVKVLETEGDAAFVAAVKSHVRAFRLPCLVRGDRPARLEFDFVFHPDERKVVQAPGVDLDGTRLNRMFSCLKHESGSLAAPYPAKALKEDLQGRVWVELHFEAADQPPRVQAVSTDWNKMLARSLEQWAADLRLPCYDGTPVDLPINYIFRLEGTSAYGFTDVGFTQFVGSIKGIRQQKIDFDFNTMGCPFDVRLTYLQPYRKNKVGQLGQYDAAREPFLDWLRSAELVLSTRALNSVFADKLTLTIPCTRLTLNP